MRPPLPQTRLLVRCAVAFALAASPFAPLSAQSQERLAELRDGKLQLPYLKHVPWELELAAAQQKATKAGKLVFAYFTRSDERCMNSLSLECGVFAEAGFKRFATRVVPYCNITTGVRGDKDQDLFRQKGGIEYPMVLFMDPAGRVLYRVKGEGLADFEAGLGKIEEIAALEKKVAAGDRQAPYDLLFKQLELHLVEFPEASKRLRRIPRLKKADKAAIAPFMFEAQVFHLVRQAGDDAKALGKVGERFFQMQKQGTLPTRDARLPFWRCVMEYARQREKIDVYEHALDTLKQEYPGREFTAEESTLKQLKFKRPSPKPGPRP